MDAKIRHQARRGAAALAAALALLVAAAQLAGAQNGGPAGARAIGTKSVAAERGRVKVAIYLRDQSAIAEWQADRRAAKIAAGIAAPGRTRFKDREAARQSQVKRLGARAAARSRASQLRATRMIERAGGIVTGSFPAPSMIFAELPERALAGVQASGIVGAVLPAGERRFLAQPYTPTWYSGADAWHAAGCTGAGASDTCPATGEPQSATGPADSPDGHGGPDFGVDDMGVNCRHDAFTGGATPSLGRTPSVSRPADAPLSAPANKKGCPGDIPGDTGSLHGNTIATIVAVKAPDHLGAAFGIDKILDPTRSCSGGMNAWLLGLPTYLYSTSVAPCVKGLTIPGAADPEEVQNRSYFYLSAGSPENTSDDSPIAQIADLGASQFGVAQAIGAGNGGPYAPLDSTLRTCYDNPDSPSCQYRVQHPCVSYNSMCMGAAVSGGGAKSSDAVSKFSSRGPSVGGRKKPDLVGPDSYGGCPNGGYGSPTAPPDPAQYSVWKGGSICGEGTSYTAPYAAAGQLLLAGVGITAPAAQKAILINSAKSITTESTNTVQQFWTPDTGWGEIDLARAYAERGNFRTGAVTEAPVSNARFYRVSGQSVGDKTTLAWNRRVSALLGANGDLPSWTSPVTSAVTTLDLYQLTLAGADNDQDVCGSSTTCGVDSSEDVDTGATVNASGVIQRWATNADNQDTVNQVRAKTAGDSIIKVVAHSPIVGVPAEPYAIASSAPLLPLSTPNVSVTAPSVSKTNPAVGENFTVSAVVKNESSGADLAAGLALTSASAAISLPVGVELVSGAANKQVGTAGTLSPQQTSAVTWTLRRTAEGVGSVKISASGSRFGETFAGESSPADVSGDHTPPTLILDAPSGWQMQATNSVTWHAQDAGSGVASVRVEASIDGVPQGALYDGAAADGTVPVTAGEGQSVSIRAYATDAAGNVSAEQAAGFSIDAIGPTISISAPPVVQAGHPVTIGIYAQNVGTPVSASYRVSGGPWMPAGQLAALGPLYAYTRVEAQAVDGFGRVAAASVQIAVNKNATRTRVKVTGKKAKRSLLVTAAPAVNGRAKVSVTCGKKKRSRTLKVRSGKASWKLYKTSGRCRVVAAFTPSETRAYRASKYAKTLRF